MIDQIEKISQTSRNDLTKKLEGIEKCMTFIGSEFENFKTNISKVQNKIESLKKENRNLK